MNRATASRASSPLAHSGCRDIPDICRMMLFNLLPRTSFSIGGCPAIARGRPDASRPASPLRQAPCSMATWSSGAARRMRRSRPAAIIVRRRVHVWTQTLSPSIKLVDFCAKRRFFRLEEVGEQTGLFTSLTTAVQSRRSQCTMQARGRCNVCPRQRAPPIWGGESAHVSHVCRKRKTWPGRGSRLASEAWVGYRAANGGRPLAGGGPPRCAILRERNYPPRDLRSLASAVKH